MWIEILFFIVFAMQIFLMSYYYPKRILSRMDYVFKHYPIETHGKLYPDGYEKALKGKILYGLINNIILVLIIIVFIAFAIAIFSDGIAVFSDSKALESFNFVPLVVGMVQGIPLLMFDLSTFKQFKQMRVQNHDPKRRAELNPRQLLSYVSPIRLSITISIFIASAFIILKLNDFNIGEKEAILLGAMLFTNSIFIGIGYFLIHGKKMDPHQSAQDRHTTIGVVIRSYTSISILASVFLVFSRSSNEFSLEAWEPIFNSLYWQLLMFLSTGTMLKYVNLKDINFDVYKASTPAEPSN